MAFKVIWSPECLADLQEIVAYIARDSPDYAADQARRIVHQIDLLEQFPRFDAAPSPS